jgi:undecaprenyl diphosphate synthase
VAYEPSALHHIAVVMDGNGRWAAKRLLPRLAGHRAGVETLKRMVIACTKANILVLTVFAFSSENWNRPKDEVSGLMDIFVKMIGKSLAQLASDGIQLCFFGNRSQLSEKVLSSLEQAEQSTSHNTKLRLNICFNYGGRWDIAQAAASLAAKGEAITEESLSKTVAFADCGYPDLLIRTGGEMRLSNFLLWQTAYSELYFSETLWPDFDEASLQAAIDAFSQRERRFGRTSEQLLHVGT